MPDLVYNKGLEEIAKAATDLDGAALKVLLVTDAYVPNKDHLFVADAPLADELSVAGYARIALANKTITRDDATDMAFLDADDILTDPLTTGESIGGVILHRDTGSDATSPLIAYYVVNPPVPTNGSAFRIRWNTPANGGVLKFVGI